jgi:phospholipid/cholesterol/gamma-HCH transport system substrate-binding protein
VKVGTVKKISFYSTSEVLVAMNIEKSLQSHIRRDAFVKIGSDGLIGNKIVIITGGTLSAPPVEKDDFLRAQKTLGTGEIMDTLQENNRNLLAITKDFKSISKKINTGNGTAGTLINDSGLAGQLRASVNELRATLSNFREVSVKSKDVLASLSTFSASLNKQGTLLNNILSDTLVFSSIKGSVNQLRDAVNKTTQLAGNLKNASDALSKKNNTAGMLLNDSVVAGSLRTTLKNLESGSRKLDEDLEAIQHNFLFRGFFRKKEKARLKALKDPAN